MWLPHAIVIAQDKLLRYLLVRRLFDDKSKYLRKAGFTLANSDDLEAAIRELASTVESLQDRENVYGVFWRTEGTLRGPVGDLSIVLIWLERASDRTFHFVTLKPGKER